MFYSKIFLFIYLIISFIKSHNITNVVVLMLENRSFDHMCGFLKQTYSTEIDGLNGNEYNLYDPENPNSKIVFVNDDAPYIDPNPGHQINDVTIQIFGKLINNQKFNESFIPPMNGFVKNAFEQSGKWGPEVMSCFNEKTVPVISTLAKEFAIFDKWFSSVPGPTDVNRMYVHSATSHGCTWNDPITLGEGYPQKTIYETLYEEGYSFKIYCEEVSTVLFFKNMRYSPYIEHFKTFYEFLDDSKSGNLPHYSFIEPRYFSIPFYYANDQHPSHDVSQGELLIKQVYEALRASPQWNSTLLIVTYDEHGGFYDHYPTPLINVPNPDGINGANPFFEFNRLGVRVPTLLISPWINKGIIIHEPTGPTPYSHYEHSSVLATLKKLFNLKSFLTKRDEWSGTFEQYYSERETPRTDCPMILPTPPSNRKTELIKNEPKQLINDLQKEFITLVCKLNNISLHQNQISIQTEEEAGKFVRKSFFQYINSKIKNY